VGKRGNCRFRAYSLIICSQGGNAQIVYNHEILVIFFMLTWKNEALATFHGLHEG